jgi:hypothetical protein
MGNKVNGTILSQEVDVEDVCTRCARSTTPLDLDLRTSDRFDAHHHRPVKETPRPRHSLFNLLQRRRRSTLDKTPDETPADP